MLLFHLISDLNVVAARASFYAVIGGETSKVLGLESQSPEILLVTFELGKLITNFLSSILHDQID